MALDQALEPEPPVLRLYTFDPVGLSLGYFQRAADFPAEDLRRRGWVLVRRVTGGGAICHADELTYAIIARPHHPIFAGDVESSYRRIHAAVANGLARLHVEAHPRANQAVASDGSDGDVVCFHRATRFDLVADGGKLVGSAQRRTRDRVLHHGSIPIGANPLAHRSACLSRLIGRSPGRAEVEEALIAGFGAGLGLDLQPSAPSAEELRRASRLFREQFDTDAWNRRR